MNKKAVILVLAIIAVAIVAVVMMRQNQATPAPLKRTPVAQQSATPVQQTARPAERVPAHYEVAPSAGSLAQTLSPERFTGMTKEAYRVAGEIPQTLAQLPCYCHCDQSIGHKSLHSCFVDEHAASCAVCTMEALMAYRLQKEQGLNPAQIRDRIVAQYSNQ
ncbi:MAG TPA: CYCXC family (seleno)protein [Pyrinomonadaceae bacterium]|jgi:hypothetical protein